MAANAVTLQANGAPVLIRDEEVCRVEECEFEALSGSGYPGSSGNFFSSRAAAYLTNLRIIIVPRNRSPQFSSLSMPMYLINAETLKAPLLGSSRIEGIVHPVAGRGLLSPARFTITFSSKQSAVIFMQFLDERIEAARRCQTLGGPLAVAYNAVCSPNSSADDGVTYLQLNTAFVDPHDPMILHLPAEADAGSADGRDAPRVDPVPRGAASDEQGADAVGNSFTSCQTGDRSDDEKTGSSIVQQFRVVMPRQAADEDASMERQSLLP
ncbi:unnamed protein product (mitochondrion) [Plasmodiophora brassicae]|uniref:GRAM domain-containing protein n=1 Tax=Plasmodiophora brassicae TaxID=37360 RepID=A0A3P3YF15_PLABS|nr:unnamed protein product [Plasmodiophora brassicae]